MKIVNILPLKPSEKLADKLMLPIMFVLRGFSFDSLQETHKWHICNVDSKKIDLNFAIENHGNDESKYSFDNKALFLFHAPIFGGLKDFSVYEVNVRYTPFYIGWIVYRSSDNELIHAQLNRLPISQNRIRMLDGNKSNWGYFFALNNQGEQIPLRKVCSGKIGDGLYKDARLF